MTGIKMRQNTTEKDWTEYSIKFAFVLLWHLFIIHCFVCNTHTFKNTLKAFGDFNKKQKCVRSNVFWYVKVCIFWKCIQGIIQWDKTQMVNKFFSDKMNGAKYVPFFRKLQLITVWLLICDSDMRWSKWFVSTKLRDFPFSIPFRFYESSYFCLTMWMGPLTL